MAFLQSRNLCYYKNQVKQTSKCLQLARFRSDPPQEIRESVSMKDACTLQIPALQISYFF